MEGKRWSVHVVSQNANYFKFFPRVPHSSVACATCAYAGALRSQERASTNGYAKRLFGGNALDK